MKNTTKTTTGTTVSILAGSNVTNKLTLTVPAGSVLPATTIDGKTLCVVTPKQWDRIKSELDDLHNGFMAVDSDGRVLDVTEMEG